MVILLDTSFLYAAAIRPDKNHERAKKLFARSLRENAELVVHNLILVETIALIQSRYGHGTAAAFIERSASLRTIMIDQALHQQVLRHFTSYGKRRLSLVDMFSFAVMKREGIEDALTFDEHFQKEGFRIYGDD